MAEEPNEDDGKVAEMAQQSQMEAKQRRQSERDFVDEGEACRARAAGFYFFLSC